MISKSIIEMIITIIWIFALTKNIDGVNPTTKNDNNVLQLRTSTTNNSTNTIQQLKQENYSNACQFNKPSLKSSFFVAIFITILVVGFCGNCTALIVILVSKPLRRMSSNLFLTALTVSDIGAIVFIIPIRLDAYFRSGNFCFTLDVCRMFNFVDSLFHVASISHLFLIAVERFVAVSSPFFYQRFVSLKTTLACIIFTWIYALTWACLSLFDWEHPNSPSTHILERPTKRLCLINNRLFYYVSYFTVYIIPLIIMGLLYLCILRIALRQARSIKSLSVVCKQNNTGSSGGGSNKQQKEVSATKTLAIIYGSFLICWLPVTIISITAKSYPTEYRSFRLEQPILFEIIFSTFVKVLPALNSALNPFLYIMFNKTFKHELKKLYNRPTPSPLSLSQLVGASGGSDISIRPSTITRNTNFLEISNHNQDLDYKQERYLKPSIVKYEKNKETSMGNNNYAQRDCDTVLIGTVKAENIHAEKRRFRE